MQRPGYHQGSPRCILQLGIKSVTPARRHSGAARTLQPSSRILSQKHNSTFFNPLSSQPALPCFTGIAAPRSAYVPKSRDIPCSWLLTNSCLMLLSCMHASFTPPKSDQRSASLVMLGAWLPTTRLIARRTQIDGSMVDQDLRILMICS